MKMQFFGPVVPYLHIISGLLFSVHLLARYSSSLQGMKNILKIKVYLNKFSSPFLDDVDASLLSDLQRQCIKQINNVFS